MGQGLIEVLAELHCACIISNIKTTESLSLSFLSLYKCLAASLLLIIQQCSLYPFLTFIVKCA